MLLMNALLTTILLFLYKHKFKLAPRWKTSPRNCIYSMKTHSVMNTWQPNNFFAMQFLKNKFSENTPKRCTHALLAKYTIIQ